MRPIFFLKSKQKKIRAKLSKGDTILGKSFPCILGPVARRPPRTKPFSEPLTKKSFPCILGPVARRPPRTKPFSEPLTFLKDVSCLADRKRGQRKGATSKNVKKCQKCFSTLLDTFRHLSSRAKNVKNRQKYYFGYFRQISHGTNFPAPFGEL